jgi:hypothetical protein
MNLKLTKTGSALSWSVTAETTGFKSPTTRFGANAGGCSFFILDGGPVARSPKETIAGSKSPIEATPFFSLISFYFNIVDLRHLF